jgi:hypothetical protein
MPISGLAAFCAHQAGIRGAGIVFIATGVGILVAAGIGEFAGVTEEDTGVADDNGFAGVIG